MLEHSNFWRANGEGECGFDGGALRFAGIGVQAGRDIHGQHGKFGGVEAFDEFHPRGVQRAIDSDAEQTINDQRGARGERVEF